MALCALMAIAAYGALASSSAAHGLGYYAKGTYPGRPHQERVFFDKTVPTGAVRDRFINNQNQWDNITSRFQFLIYSDTADTTAARECSRRAFRMFGEPASLISFRRLDGRGKSQAVTETCSDFKSGRLEYFLTTVDNEDRFYYGRGDAPSSAVDLASLAVHELGHAAGFFYHYDDPEATTPANESICRNTSEQQTMCRRIYAGQSGCAPPRTTTSTLMPARTIAKASVRVPQEELAGVLRSGPT